MENQNVLDIYERMLYNKKHTKNFKTQNSPFKICIIRENQDVTISPQHADFKLTSKKQYTKSETAFHHDLWSMLYVKAQVQGAMLKRGHGLVELC